MGFSQGQISSFRYWIQGYPKFYEPLVAEYFRVMGYQVHETVTIRRPDIETTIERLFDGHKTLGPQVDSRAVIAHLRQRQRIQPDLWVVKDQEQYLVELKSWGGSHSGVFDLATARRGFVEDRAKSAFLLIDQLEGKQIAGKILVVSSRSPEHPQVLALLATSFNTSVELLYLDEIFAAPQMAGTIEKYLGFLDAAVAELKNAFRGKPS
jgi:hypothetical protein